MNNMQSNYDKQLNPLDTENQTYGCRQKNPRICSFNCMEGVCAFVRDDYICKHPSRSWKNRYLSMLPNDDDKYIPCIFVRLSNFFEYDYIDEHIKCDREKGYVWMLKLGRIINKDYLNDVIDKKGGIIIKTPSKKFVKYYYADLLSMDPENDELYFPEYYKELFEYEGYNLSKLIKNNNWLKISNLREISEDKYNSFIVSKNKKNLFEIAGSTRTPYIYAKKEKDVSI